MTWPVGGISSGDSALNAPILAASMGVLELRFDFTRMYLGSQTCGRCFLVSPLLFEAINLGNQTIQKSASS